MTRAIHKLSSAFVKCAPIGKHSDGGGLWLHQRRDGGAQWFLRITVHGRRREMGLGSLREVTLKQAREAASVYRSQCAQNIDPILLRATQSTSARERSDLLTQVAEDCFNARKADLKEGGKAGRWYSPLKLHVLPKLGHLPVSAISQRHIRDTFSPIWQAKPATAKKAMERLSICLMHGAALGLEVDLQAVPKAKALLGAQSHSVSHTPFLAWKDVPEFYHSLNEKSVTQLALRLLILTIGTRSKPLRYIRTEQIFDDVWVVPADVMKGRKGRTKEYRVPLSRQALAIIDEAKPLSRDGFLFPGSQRGVISDATMSRLMERRGMTARPHGFRSSFRVWCSESAKASWDVAEACLAHERGSLVERSYNRTDLLADRRVLMQQWADFVCGEKDA